MRTLTGSGNRIRSFIFLNLLDYDAEIILVSLQLGLGLLMDLSEISDHIPQETPDCTRPGINEKILVYVASSLHFFNPLDKEVKDSGLALIVYALASIVLTQSVSSSCLMWTSRTSFHWRKKVRRAFRTSEKENSSLGIISWSRYWIIARVPQQTPAQ
jgi:hypothetical protein